MPRPAGIYVSPFARCLQTIEPYAGEAGARPTVDEDVGEVFIGEWEGLSFEEIISEDDLIFVMTPGHVEQEKQLGGRGKVHVIEEVDWCLPLLTALKPDVFVITGDHSTPATYKSHSWHPVPTLLASAWCRGEAGAKYGERDCRRGTWGAFHATSLMPEALGHAGKLARYGA